MPRLEAKELKKEIKILDAGDDLKIGARRQVVPRLESITIEITDKQIIIKLPKNETDTQFIRSFKYFRWNKSMYCWIVPNYRDNIDKLKSYFAKRNVEITEHKTTEIYTHITIKGFEQIKSPLDKLKIN